MKRNTLLLLLLMAATLLTLPACARVVAASPDSSGEIEIVLSDYQFEPEVIRLKVGQTVHLKLRNEGDKMHEFMAGRDLQIHGNFTEGFGQDFFAGITPEITGPGMVMGMEGMDMEGMQMEGGEMDMAEGEEHTEGEMEMGEDEHAAGEEHAEEEMPMEEEGDHTEGEMGHEEEPGAEHAGEEGEEHDEAAADGQFGAIQRPLMDAHAGLMVMLDPQTVAPGEVTTVTFTVPEDKVGRWQYGCFQERGQHYDDGMNGIIIVEP